MCPDRCRYMYTCTNSHTGFYRQTDKYLFHLYTDKHIHTLLEKSHTDYLMRKCLGDPDMK